MIDPARASRSTRRATSRASAVAQSPADTSHVTIRMWWRATTAAMNGVCSPWGGRKKAGHTPR